MQTKQLVNVETGSLLPLSDARPPHLAGVYVIRCTTTGREYIGSTATDFRRRYLRHRTALRSGQHWIPTMQADWNVHGEPSFEFVILEITTSNDAVAREQYWAGVLAGERYNLRAIAEPKSTPRCPACNARLGSAGQQGQAVRLGYCRQCKPAPPPRRTSYTCPNCGSTGLSLSAYSYSKQGQCTRFCTNAQQMNPQTPDDADVFAALLADAVDALATAGCSLEALDALRRSKRHTVVLMLRTALEKRQLEG